MRFAQHEPSNAPLPLFTANHVSHLENVSEEEINRLLGMVVDVENLFMSVHKEEDTDTKQVYFYLFKVSDEGGFRLAETSSGILVLNWYLLPAFLGCSC